MNNAQCLVAMHASACKAAPKMDAFGPTPYCYTTKPPCSSNDDWNIQEMCANAHETCDSISL